MIIRDERELALFEETLNRCQHTLWLISSSGKQYDLKNPLERCIGIVEMLKSQGADEPEIFTTSYGDEMRLFEFIAAQKAYDHTTQSRTVQAFSSKGFVFTEQTYRRP